MLKVVEAARSIILGAWMIVAIEKTTPQAARLISGATMRAITALISGSSAVINSQLAANGHQVRMIRCIDNAPSLVEKDTIILF